MTIRELLREAETELAGAGVPDANFDAREIIKHCLKIDNEIFYLSLDKVISNIVKDKVLEYIELRVKRYPLQYIIGEWDFHDISLKIREGVFIPRPETEMLIELIASRFGRDSTLRGFEIGIGSGAISIALLKKMPNLTMTANDISQKAIDLAGDNAKLNFVSERLRLFRGSLFEALSDKVKFDFIVSNPPYIDPALAGQLEPELQYEPDEALYSANSGRKIPSKIVEKSPRHLEPTGALFLELASYNVDFLNTIAKQYFSFTQLIHDCNNLKRFMVGSSKKQ